MRTTIASSPVVAQSARKTSYADIHLRALEKAAPPSIIVDANANILHITEGAGRFLRYVAGELTRNLLTLAHPDSATGDPHHAVSGAAGRHASDLAQSANRA